MSPSRSRRSRSKGKGGAGRQSGGTRKRSGDRQRSRPPAIDPNRPLWSNPQAESGVRELIGAVRPVADPTALVRSLGPPPLGRFADGAQHYYAAVYEKAQHFAVAMATANGVLVREDDGSP